MRQQLLFIPLLLLTFSGQLATAKPNKSISQKEINGEENDTHTVKQGETLYRIALKYGVSIEDIKRANPSIDPGKLPVGHQLKIPVKFKERADISLPNNQKANQLRSLQEQYASDAKATQTKKYVAVRPETERMGYTVQEGETIESICTRYVLTEEKFRALNNNMQGEVSPGQHVILEMRMLTEEITASGDIGWGIVWTSDGDGKALTANDYTTDKRGKRRGTEEKLVFETVKNFSPPAKKGYERIHIVHTIGVDETLNSIAKKYNMSVAELRELNQFQLYDELTIGQNLIIGMDEIPLSEEKRKRLATAPMVGPKETMPKQNLQNTTAHNAREMQNDAMGDSGKEYATATASRSLSREFSRDAAPTTVEADKPVTPSYHKNSVMAVEVNQTNSKYGKHVAWHHEASIGSYIKITNPLNGKITFAKVVGKPADSNASIEVSSDIAKQLEAATPKFEVLLEYND